uniref:Uncharacterized protein n=1 Tax=Timema monikensis TaxID=170555 RepID=A0A7R9EDA0_9NEOP|nr:unnamed protein product [Timema monikensis]
MAQGLVAQSSWRVEGSSLPNCTIWQHRKHFHLRHNSQVSYFDVSLALLPRLWAGWSMPTLVLETQGIFLNTCIRCASTSVAIPQFMKKIQKSLYGTVRFTDASDVVFDCCAHAYIGGGGEEGAREMQLSNGARDVTTSNNTFRVCLKRRGNGSSRLESQEECPHGILDDPSDLAQIQTVPGDSSHTENMVQDEAPYIEHPTAMEKYMLPSLNQMTQRRLGPTSCDSALDLLTPTTCVKVLVPVIRHRSADISALLTRAQFKYLELGPSLREPLLQRGRLCARSDRGLFNIVLLRREGLVGSSWPRCGHLLRTGDTALHPGLQLLEISQGHQHVQGVRSFRDLLDLLYVGG